MVYQLVFGCIQLKITIMAYPTIQGITSGAVGSRTTSHSISIPGGAVPGIMLVLLIVEGENTTLGYTGFEYIWNESVIIGGGTYTYKIYGMKGYYNGNAISFTTSASVYSYYVAYTFSNAKYSSIAINVEGVTYPITNPDPPNCNSYENGDSIVIEGMVAFNYGSVITGSSTGFGSLTTQVCADSVGSISTAHGTFSGTSYDPSAMTSEDSLHGDVFTIIIPTSTSDSGVGILVANGRVSIYEPK